MRQPRAAHLQGQAAKTVQFDPQRRAGSPRLKQAVLRLAGLIEASEKRARRRKAQDHRKLTLAVEAVVCNFIAVGLQADAETALAVPRDNNAMWSGSRYQEPVYGGHFLAVLDAMEGPALGWAECLARGYHYADSGKGKLTAVRSLPALWSALGLTALGWADLARAPIAEPLILRGPKVHRHGAGPALDYLDTDRTRKMRREVQRINGYLEAAPVSLLDFPEADPTNRSLRRTFNNGVWTEGGRLFGGFWQPMSREGRFRHLRIGTSENPEGEPVAYVDFQQLFPRLLYFHSLVQPPEGDLYDIAGDGQSRAGWKALTNAMLSAKTPLRRWPDGTRERFPAGMEFKEALEAMRRKHAAVAHHFGTGIGLKLMAMESAIMVEALRRLFASGIAALPVHDAVLVAASQAEAAGAILEQTSEDTVGFRALIDVTKSE